MSTTAISCCRGNLISRSLVSSVPLRSGDSMETLMASFLSLISIRLNNFLWPVISFCYGNLIFRSLNRGRWLDVDVGSKFSSPNQHPAEHKPPLILPSSLVICLPWPERRPKSDLMDSKLQRPESFPHLNLQVSQPSSEYQNVTPYLLSVISNQLLKCTCLCLASQGSPGCRWAGVGWVFGPSRGEKVDDCRHGVLVAGAVKLAAGKKTICD